MKIPVTRWQPGASLSQGSWGHPKAKHGPSLCLVLLGPSRPLSTGWPEGGSFPQEILWVISGQNERSMFRIFAVVTLTVTWLVGGLEHEIYDFPYIGNVIIPTDFYIFQRGWNHQPDELNYITLETCNLHFFLPLPKKSGSLDRESRLSMVSYVIVIGLKRGEVQVWELPSGELT